MRHKTLLEEQRKAIKKRYTELYEKKHKGKRVYNYEYILQTLSDEFWLSTHTIDKIINK